MRIALRQNLLRNNLIVSIGGIGTRALLYFGIRENNRLFCIGQGAFRLNVGNFLNVAGNLRFDEVFGFFKIFIVHPFLWVEAVHKIYLVP